MLSQQLWSSEFWSLAMSSGSGQVRGVIELFCKILEENISCAVRAEALRQAKFNKESAVSL